VVVVVATNAPCGDQRESSVLAPTKLELSSPTVPVVGMPHKISSSNVSGQTGSEEIGLLLVNSTTLWLSSVPVMLPPDQTAGATVPPTTAKLVPVDPAQTGPTLTLGAQNGPEWTRDAVNASLTRRAAVTLTRCTVTVTDLWTSGFTRLIL